MEELEVTKTLRGFTLLKFTDSNGEACTLQKSSSANEDKIWLGCEEANPKVLRVGQGWVPVPFPEDTLFTTRMHLTRDNVRELLPHLQHFVETGELL